MGENINRTEQVDASSPKELNRKLLTAKVQGKIGSKFYEMDKEGQNEYNRQWDQAEQYVRDAAVLERDTITDAGRGVSEAFLTVGGGILEGANAIKGAVRGDEHMSDFNLNQMIQADVARQIKNR